MNKMQFKQLKSNDETIIHYKIVDKNGYYSRETYSVFCQKPYDEKCDIAALVEDTLHRILEEGASPEDIEEITGLIKNRDEEFVKQLCHTKEEYEQYLKSPKW